MKMKLHEIYCRKQNGVEFCRIARYAQMYAKAHIHTYAQNLGVYLYECVLEKFRDKEDVSVMQVSPSVSVTANGSTMLFACLFCCLRTEALTCDLHPLIEVCLSCMSRDVVTVSLQVLVLHVRCSSVHMRLHLCWCGSFAFVHD
jgi:hypothetical protein